MIVHDERKDRVPATIARMTPMEEIFVGRGNSDILNIFERADNCVLEMRNQYSKKKVLPLLRTYVYFEALEVYRLSKLVFLGRKNRK